MQVILVTLVFLALELYLSRRRRITTVLEIEEALGERDSLISAMQHEITDKFTQSTEHARAAAYSADQAAQDVEAMKVGAKDVERAIERASTINESREYASDISLDVDNTNSIVLLAQTVETLGKQCKILHEQCNTNNKNAQGLRRDVNHVLSRLGSAGKALEHIIPPLGEKPSFPSPQEPHCYDGPDS